VQTPPEGLMRKRNIFAFDFCKRDVSKLLLPSSLFKPINHIRACIFYMVQMLQFQVEKTWENFMVALGLGT
jgi:hypothetical protein